MPRDLVDLALVRIESEGQVLRGNFSGGAEHEVVQSPRAGAHSSHDARTAAPRNRASRHRRFHALPFTLAARRAAARNCMAPMVCCR